MLELFSEPVVRHDDPDTQRHVRATRKPVDRQTLHSRSDSPRYPHCRSLPGPWQAHQELIATQSVCRVVVADETSEQARYRAQHGIANRMSIAVIHAFEAVDIDRDQGIVTSGASCCERAPVAQPGEGVGERGGLRSSGLATRDQAADKTIGPDASSVTCRAAFA